ncbi:hypothetical protein DSN97_07010 [Deferribacteraceae bacterium V6Fe1]|nr:hypothetical protein DSN97_07010 [Deferribacteraceae bacterium V6Fe1]
MDKNVFNKQQVLTNEVGIKLKQENEIVVQTEHAQTKTIDKREKKDSYKQKNRDGKKDKNYKRKKFVEEEHGQIIDFKG